MIRRFIEWVKFCLNFNSNKIKVKKSRFENFLIEKRIELKKEKLYLEFKRMIASDLIMKFVEIGKQDIEEVINKYSIEVVECDEKIEEIIKKLGNIDKRLKY